MGVVRDYAGSAVVDRRYRLCTGVELGTSSAFGEATAGQEDERRNRLIKA